MLSRGRNAATLVSVMGIVLGGSGGAAAASEVDDPTVEDIIAGVTGTAAEPLEGVVELGSGVAVQPLSNAESFVSEHGGGTSVVTEIADGSGFESVSFELVLDGDLDFVLLPEGGGAVVDRDALDDLISEAAGVADIAPAIVATIAEPWAVDAKGRSLDTFYTSDGSKLVQHVNTDRAEFPIAADPTISFGRQWTMPVTYVKYSKGETMDISTYRSSSLTALGRLACGALPVVGDVCKSLVSWRADALVNTAKRAVKKGECLTIWVQFPVLSALPFHSIYTRKC